MSNLDRQYFSLCFGGLSWCDWEPFTRETDLKTITTAPGLYRIRSENCEELVYIGQTGRNLRQRLKQLQKGTFSDGAMPFNDPHTAAPNLWVWLREGIGKYECSAAKLECDYQMRQVIEDYLLWLARVEAGCSTLCNHGKFHPGYSKSSNKKEGRVGEKISPKYTSYNQLKGSDTLPLAYKSDPLSSNWMTLQWSGQERLFPENVRKLEKRNAVYKIIAGDVGEVIYIGESSDLKNRMSSHIKPMVDVWGSGLLYSYTYLQHDLTSIQRHQIEVDLVGGFYHQYKRAPLRQYNPLERSPRSGE